VLVDDDEDDFAVAPKLDGRGGAGGTE